MSASMWISWKACPSSRTARKHQATTVRTTMRAPTCHGQVSEVDLPTGVLRHYDHCRWHSIEGGACDCGAERRACWQGAVWAEHFAEEVRCDAGATERNHCECSYRELKDLAEQLRAGEAK